MYTLGEIMRIKGGPGSGNYNGPGSPRFAKNVNAEYPVDITSSLYTHMYGGMPTGGGYGSSTEYEIGHQRYAEAAHCILGSLGKAVSSKYQSTYIEEEHVREELGIMQKTIEEYSRSVYNDQLEQKREDPARSHYTDETVSSLVTNSKALSNKVKDFQTKLGDVRPDLKKIANLSYDSLAVLAENAPKIKGSLRYNVFKEQSLKDVTQKLSDSIDSVYGVSKPSKEKIQTQKRIPLPEGDLGDTADVDRMTEILFGKKELDTTITKAKPKITRKPLSKEQQEFVFRETTSKFEKKFQKTMIEYFKDQEKAALSVLKKGFEGIETKGGPGSGNYNGPGDPRFAHEGGDGTSTGDVPMYSAEIGETLDHAIRRLRDQDLTKDSILATEEFKGTMKSKEFKDWFVGSQMMDNNGEPIVFFHGDVGFVRDNTPGWFTTDYSGAKQYAGPKGKVIAVALKITKPLYPGSDFPEENPDGTRVEKGVWITKTTLDKQVWLFTDDYKPKGEKSFESQIAKSITKASPNALPDRFNFEGWAYKDSEWNRRLQAEGGLFIKEVYEAEGRRVWEQLALQLQDGLEGTFDIDNPLIAEFIQNYSYKFAQGINETTVGMLQGAMTAGMDEGLGMDGIAKLIREVFDNCTKYRSMLIARTETIRASNGAAKMTYEQSEVVVAMEWLTTRDDRRCEFCLAMDGKVVSLNENFFDLGDSMTIGSGANKVTMKFDYEDVGYPPLHPACRCTVVAKVYDEFLIPKSISTLHQEGLDSAQNLVLTRFSSPLNTLSGVFGLGLIFKGGHGSGIEGHRTLQEATSSLSEKDKLAALNRLRERIDNPISSSGVVPTGKGEEFKNGLNDDSFNYKKLHDKTSDERKWMTNQILEVGKEAKVELAKSQGYCAEVSTALWDKLGKPKGLTPYSVMYGEEEHVLLYSKKGDFVIDPTGSQFDQRIFGGFKGNTPYKKWMKLTDKEIQGARDELKNRLEKLSKPKSIGLSVFFKMGQGNFGHTSVIGHRGGSAPSKGGSSQTRLINAKSREDFPEHLKKTAVPPAWTDLKYDPNPDADLLVTGRVKSGKIGYVYSERYKAQQAEEKWARVLELQIKYESIKKENSSNRKSKDSETVENADCLAVVMNMGIRAGSEEAMTKGEKTFGATSLRGEHVKEVNGVVNLVFPGKSGVSQNLPVADQAIGSILLTRAKAAGKDGKLFNTDDASLRKYSKSLDGGGFKTKDFRTRLATEIAEKEVKKLGNAKPKSEKEYKKMIKAVATIVSTKLGNTPTVALQSYIYPGVFSKWRAAL